MMCFFFKIMAGIPIYDLAVSCYPFGVSDGIGFVFLLSCHPFGISFIPTTGLVPRVPDVPKELTPAELHPVPSRMKSRRDGMIIRTEFAEYIKPRRGDMIFSNIACITNASCHFLSLRDFILFQLLY